MNNELNQMTPVSMLALMNSNKSQRKSFCLQIIEQIENGEVDPLKVHVYLKNLEAIFNTLNDDKIGQQFAARFKAALLSAAEKEDGKTFEKYNAKFQIKEVGTKYDWTVCNDKEVNDLIQSAELINERLKERREFLKNIPEKGIEVLDESTGEMVTIYRPAKASTTAVSVTLS